MRHTVLDNGTFKKVDKLHPDHLSFPSSRDFFSMPSNLITGLSGVSGGRILLGAKASLQSIPLVNRERALVESSDVTDKQSTQEKFGKHYLSVTARHPGEVTEVTKDIIKVKNDDGKSHTYQLYNNFNLGRKSFISHEAQVKPGDKVKPDEILATSNFTDKHGNMALGTNLTTAVMPFRSDNFEDAYAVTETGAKKLEAEQMIKFHIEKKFGVETGKHKFISLFPNKYTNTQISHVDEDGIVKPGTKLTASDPVILAYSPRALKSTDLALGKLSKVLKHAYKDNSEIWDYEHGGEVVDVAKSGDLVTIHIKTSRSLLPGDKIGSIFGAKGVATIIPDSQAPTQANGKPVDIMLNSMSITSRVAPALAVTLGLGKLANKQGKTIKMDQFRKDSSIQNVVDVLKKHNISDTESLYDPTTGKQIEAVVGPLYYNRLTHISEDKLSTRSQGTGYCFDDKTEVLTSRGWVNWSKILDDDLFFTTKDHKHATYIRASEIIRQDYHGLMYGFEGKGVDYLVTPNHKFVILSGDTGKLVTKTAEEFHNKRGSFIKGGIKLGDSPIHGHVDVPAISTKGKNFEEVSIKLTDFSKFLGIWISEGSVRFDENEGRYRVYVWQDQKANPVKYGKIQKMLSLLPFDWYVHKSSEGINKGFYTSHAGLADYLIKNVGKYCENKVIPNWLVNSTQRNRLLILKYLIMGDGSKYDEGYNYYTCSKQLADSVQQLCILSGLYASVRDYKYDKNLNKQYVVIITKTRTHYLRNQKNKEYKNFYTTNYTGKIYCARIPETGLLYVRRNGKCFLSHNSFDNQPSKTTGECLTDKHECLTIEGWKNIKDIKIGDVVYSLSDDNIIEEALVDNTTEYLYNGKLYTVDSQLVKMETTLNHKLPIIYEQNVNSKYTLLTAEQIKDSKIYYVKSSGTYLNTKNFPLSLYISSQISDINGRAGAPLKKLEFSDDALFLLAGLYIGDGNAIWNPKSGNYGIELTQKKPETCKEIEALCKNYGLKYRYESANKKYKFLSKTLGNYFRKLGHSHEKYIPNELFLGSKKQLELLYLGLLITDGSRKKSGNSYCTTSKKLAGDIQRLLLLLGKSGSCSLHKGGHTVKFPNGYSSVARDSYVVYEINHKLTPEVIQKNVKLIDYSDMVYCVTLNKNGTFYTRKDGKCHWTGNSSKRIGNLGTTALLSHDVKHVLEDIGTVKGTKNDEFWRALKLGQTPPTPKVPFIFNKFIASLQAAGVNVERDGNAFNILPLTDKNTLALSNGPINKPTMFKPHLEEMVHEPGGLFDPTKVGLLGDKFNHIDLNNAVPNPISEDYLRKLLGVTKAKYNDLVVSGEMGNKLAAINLDGKIAEMKKYIESGKRTNRDTAVKVLEFLTTLKKNSIHPKDLMIHKVPILPAQFRPASKMGEVVLTSDVNNLYKDLILNNNALRDTKDVPQEVVDKLKQNQYDAVKAVFGLGDPINKKHTDKNVKGLLATMLGLKGGTAKSTMFQAKVVNKSLDLVGRAVLTPDARLDVDQASVPQDLLWQVYKPFIIRRLVMKGVSATAAVDYVKKHNSMAVQALQEEMKVRPGIVTRDPAWHKFNLMGFNLVANPNPKDKTVKLNPLVFKGFGADNDGDQLNIHVPATEEARKEVLEKMLPSKNLLSPKSFSPVLIPSNEAALGLYSLSTEKNNKAAKKFKTEDEAAQAYHRGEVEIGDAVEIG